MNPDGSITAEVSASPIHWKDKQGKWNDIDNNLVSSSDNAVFPLQNASNNFKVKFSKNVSSSVTKIVYDDKSVEFKAVGANPATAKTKGSSITYSDIYLSVDFKYDVFATGVKEEIVLADSQAQNQFQFEIVTQGLTPKTARLRDFTVIISTA